MKKWIWLFMAVALVVSASFAEPTPDQIKTFETDGLFGVPLGMRESEFFSKYTDSKPTNADDPTRGIRHYFFNVPKINAAASFYQGAVYSVMLLPTQEYTASWGGESGVRRSLESKFGPAQRVDNIDSWDFPTGRVLMLAKGESVIINIEDRAVAKKVAQIKAPTASATVAEVAPKAGLNIVSAASREVERMQDVVRYSWKVDIQNGSTNLFHGGKDLLISLRDKDGFELDSVSQTVPDVGAGETISLTGSSSMKAAIWDRVDSTAARFRR